ncbi:MAG: hypothetical protein ABII00_00215 [Elusimicrobiota bacterium]
MNMGHETSPSANGAFNSGVELPAGVPKAIVLPYKTSICAIDDSDSIVANVAETLACLKDPRRVTWPRRRYLQRARAV